MNGRFEFLQLKGITPEQLQQMRTTSTVAVLSRLAETDPPLVSPAEDGRGPS